MLRNVFGVREPHSSVCWSFTEWVLGFDYKDRILYVLDLMIKDAQNNTLEDRLA